MEDGLSLLPSDLVQNITYQAMLEAGCDNCNKMKSPVEIMVEEYLNHSINKLAEQIEDNIIVHVICNMIGSIVSVTIGDCDYISLPWSPVYHYLGNLRPCC